jgi:ubiquitin carboxyl-terminal hydrolase 7
MDKQETFDVLAPKNGSVSDIIAILIKKAGLENELEAGAIRVYEVTSHNKIHRSLSHETSVSNINDYVKLVAERVPEDERDEKQTDFISTFHFEKDPAKSHGIPFYFRIMEGEKFSETKKRLEQRIGIKGKAFEKIKFAVVKKQSFPNPKPQYLTDDDIIWEKTASEDFLGLDHVDKHRQLRNGGQQELFLK